jgi:hypothetical protein
MSRPDLVGASEQGKPYEKGAGPTFGLLLAARTVGGLSTKERSPPMIHYPSATLALGARGSERGPESQAEPKAEAKAAKGHAVRAPVPAAAAGGGLGNTANIAAAQREKVSIPTLRGRRETSILLRSAAQELPYPQEDVAGRRKKNGEWAEAYHGIAPEIQRLRRCGRVAKGPFAILTIDGDNRAGVSNVETCGRALVCAHCAKQSREERRQLLHSMIKSARSQQLGVYFATLTVRHYRRHSLEQSLSIIREAMHQITGTQRYRKYAKSHGLGFVSVVEFTWSRKHGFHPHLHMAFFQGVSPVAKGEGGKWAINGSKPETWSAAEEREFVAWFRTKWLALIGDSELPDADGRYAFDWRGAFGTESDEEVNGELDEYMLKDQGVGKGLELYEKVLTDRADKLARVREKSAVGGTYELMRADLKTSDTMAGQSLHHTLPMFEVLGIALANGGKGPEAMAWFEYEKSSRGLRYYRVSHGMEAALGLAEDTRTDEEIVEDRKAIGVPVIEVKAESWYKMVSAGHLPAILGALEEADKPLAARVKTVLDDLADMGYTARAAGEYSRKLIERSKAPPG